MNLPERKKKTESGSYDDEDLLILESALYREEAEQKIGV